jgi:hypothetical protein
MIQTSLLSVYFQHIMLSYAVMLHFNIKPVLVSAVILNACHACNPVVPAQAKNELSACEI